ncbi:hypothetical protein JTB14_037333 [Gonioctena quinquepunctata]|nr:hypothetical protein JTB14_037333 [Gonioctena quinquepunctata]
MADCDSNDEEHLENNALAPAVDDPLVYDQNELLAVTNDEDLSWDSADELPLTSFSPVPNVLSKPTFQWSKNLNNVIHPTQFNQDSEPDIPDNIEMPLDYSMVLFSEDLLQKIVFETNLYATQNGIRGAQAHTEEYQNKDFANKKWVTIEVEMSSRMLEDLFLLKSTSPDTFD